MDIIDKKIYKNPYILIVILITWIKKKQCATTEWHEGKSKFWL